MTPCFMLLQASAYMVRCLRLEETTGFPSLSTVQRRQVT